MSEELKPCPKCGSSNVRPGVPGQQDWWDKPGRTVCDGCGWSEPDEFWNTRHTPDVQAAIDDEKQNPWKAAIIDELIVDCIYAKEHDSNPKKALGDAIEWNCTIALDPSVSKEARDLQQQAIDAALSQVADDLDVHIFECHETSWTKEALSDISDSIRKRIGTNQLATAQARIAELELELEEARKDAALWRDLVSQQKFNNKPQVGFAINRTIERVAMKEPEEPKARSTNLFLPDGT